MWNIIWTSCDFVWRDESTIVIPNHNHIITYIYFRLRNANDFLFGYGRRFWYISHHMFCHNDHVFVVIERNVDDCLCDDSMSSWIWFGSFLIDGDNEVSFYYISNSFMINFMWDQCRTWWIDDLRSRRHMVNLFNALIILQFRMSIPNACAKLTFLQKVFDSCMLFSAEFQTLFQMCANYVHPFHVLVFVHVWAIYMCDRRRSDIFRWIDDGCKIIFVDFLHNSRLYLNRSLCSIFVFCCKL